VDLFSKRELRPTIACSRQDGLGAELRSGDTLLERREGGVGLCGRNHEGPQLMRQSSDDAMNAFQTI
jgi:hypothetical protein